MKLLGQKEANGLLRKYKIPLVPSKICKNVTECKSFAKNSYPVALKIDSEDVIHKSDIGAVLTNISDDKELSAAYNQIISNVKKFRKDAKINGMLVQKQVSGHSILIGGKRDTQFGPVILFGLGGVLVELLKDVSKRIAPISKKEAKDMVDEIKASELLKGYRGQEGAHIVSLADIIVSLSKMMMDNEGIIEVDFNPVISNIKRSYVVDARIMVKEDEV